MTRDGLRAPFRPPTCAQSLSVLTLPIHHEPPLPLPSLSHFPITCALEGGGLKVPSPCGRHAAPASLFVLQSFRRGAFDPCVGHKPAGFPILSFSHLIPTRQQLLWLALSTTLPSDGKVPSFPPPPRPGQPSFRHSCPPSTAPRARP